MGVIGEALVRIRPETSHFKGETESKVNDVFKDVAKAATGALAIGGAAEFLKDAIGNAVTFQEQMQGVDNTLKNVGQGSERARAMADHYSEALSKLSGFARVEVAASLQKAVQGTGSLGKAMQVETVAANLARSGHIGLAQSTLLVTKAFDGNTSSLKRMGINFKPVTAAHDALTAKIRALTTESRGATGAVKKQDEAQIYALKGQLDAAKATDKANTSLKVQKMLTDLSANGMKTFAATTAGKIAQAKNAIDELETKIGLALLPVIGKLASFTADKVGQIVEDWPKIEHAIDPVRAAIERIATDLAPAFDAVLGVIGSVVSTLGGAGQTFKDIAIGVAAFVVVTQTIAIATAIYEALSAAIFLVRNAQVALDVAMEANPVGIIVVALLALSAALYEAYQHSATFRNIVNAAFAAVKAVALDALGWINKTGLPDLKNAWNTVAPIVQRAASLVVGAIKSIVDFIRSNWSTIGPAILAPMKAAWDQVALVVNTAVTVIGNAIDLVKNVVEGKWGAAWQNLKNIAGAAIGLAIGTITHLLQALAPSVGKLAEAAAHALVTEIKKAPGQLTGLGGDLATAVGNAIGNAASAAATDALDIGAKIKDGAVNGISGLAGMIKDAAEKEIKKGLSHLNPFSPVEHGGEKFIGLPIMEGAVAGVGKGAQPLAAILDLSVRRAVEGLSTTINDASAKPTAATKAMTDRITAQVAGISTRVQAEQGRINTAFSSLTSNAFAAFDGRTQQILDKNSAKWDAWGKKITATAKLTTDRLQSDMNVALSDLQSQQDAALARLDASLSASQAAINGQKAVLTPSEAILKEVQDAHDAQARADTMAAAQKQKADAIAAGDATALATAEKAIADAAYAQQIIDLQAAATKERAAADAAAADQLAAVQAQHDAEAAVVKASYDAQIQAATDYWNTRLAAVQAGLEQQQAKADANAKREQLNIGSEQAYKKGILTDELANLQTQLDKHPELYAKVHSRILKMFRDDFGPNYRIAGQNLGDAFAQGMRDSFDGVHLAASQLAAEVGRYLKVRSPTEKGPMSDLDTWWTGLADTLAGGVDRSALGGIVDGISAPGFAAGTRASSPGERWDEDAFIAKLAAALGREIPATTVAIQQAAAAGVTADDLARAAMR